MSDNQNNTDNTVTALTVDEIVTFALNGDFSAYAGANVSIKANVRKALKAGMEGAIAQMDLNTANTYLTAQNGCIGTKAVKAPNQVNHAEIVAKRAYMLICAGNALIQGKVVPNGLNPDDVDKSDVEAHFASYMDESVTMDESDIKGIYDIAAQKVTKSDIRVDIAQHVAEVIEGAESGTFYSVRYIASQITTSAPNGCPSDGAVAMRLFPQKGQCTLNGVIPGNHPETGIKGLFVA